MSTQVVLSGSSSRLEMLARLACYRHPLSFHVMPPKGEKELTVTPRLGGVKTRPPLARGSLPGGSPLVLWWPLWSVEPLQLVLAGSLKSPKKQLKPESDEANAPTDGVRSDRSAEEKVSAPSHWLSPIINIKFYIYISNPKVRQFAPAAERSFPPNPRGSIF